VTILRTGWKAFSTPSSQTVSLFTGHSSNLWLVGLATRYAAAVGAFMVLNFWFAKGAPLFAGTNNDIAWFVILVVLGMVPAGKIAGLDDGLSDVLPFLR
jgi:uncharacterized membrane protein YphA (DoxX/SURF4 family)